MSSALAALIVAAALPSTAGATVLTFDDTYAGFGGSPVSYGYGGLNWSNFYALDAVYDYSYAHPSGYANGVVSGTNVVFNGFASSASITGSQFDFNGAYLTGAWNNGLTIVVTGSANGSLLYSQAVTVDSYQPTWFQFDFMGIDTLTFSSYGGYPAGYAGGGSHFAMDNFTFNEVFRPISDWIDSSLDLVVGTGGFFGTSVTLKDGDSLAERNLTIESNGNVKQQGGTHAASGLIVNNGHYRQTGGSFSGKNETIGFGYGDSGKFEQSGGTHTVDGTLTLGHESGSSGVYNLVAGVLNAVEEIIGDKGVGDFNQSGGTHTVAQTLTLGKQAGGQGTYMLTGGHLETGDLIVGDAGSGFFSQGGGTYGYKSTNTVNGTLTLGKQAGGSGTYHLIAGALNAVNEVIGDAGYGFFAQDGGTNTVAQTLTLGKQAGGYGSYDLSDGALISKDQVIGDAGEGYFTQGSGSFGYRSSNTVNGTLTLGKQAGGSGTYRLVAGALAAVNEVIGDAGHGSFAQDGGTNTVQQTLTLGKQAGGKGFYDLRDGTLAANDEIIGDAGEGNFTQGEGTYGYRTSNKVQGTLTLGKQAGSHGTYNLIAGALTAAKQVVGDGGVGVFNQTGGTNNVTDTLTLGKQAGSYGEYNLKAGALVAFNQIIGDAGEGKFTQGEGSYGYSSSNTVSGKLTLGKQAGSNGAYNLIAGELITRGTVVGDAGTGAFNQVSGNHFIEGDLVIGKQAEGTGGYTLSGGHLATSETIVGDAGFGTFIQSGGTHYSGLLTLGRQAGSYGSYSMLNGVNNVKFDLIVGDAGVGVFTQAGGTNTVERLRLGWQAGSSGTYNLRGGNLNVTGDIIDGAGQGSLLISGGALNFGAGNHDVDVDTLKLSGQGVINLTNGGTATFQKAVVHNGKAINLDTGTNAIFNGAFSGKGPFTGGGTATFNSVLNVGDGPVTFNVAGNMVLGEHSKSIMEVAGTARGTGYDAVDVGNMLTLNGELKLIALNGFNAQVGNVFDLYKAESILGQFDLLSLFALGQGLAWKVEYLIDAIGTTDIVRLSVVSSVPLPASVWLLQSALFGLFMAKRYRRKSK